MRIPKAWVFGLATLGYFVILFAGSWWLGFFSPSATPLEPHEWGDVLAGVFSPVAFFWLVYAALSQRAELELQRSELALQREELRQNNETQAAQQAQMRRQADLMSAQSFAQLEPLLVCEQVKGDRNSSFVIIEIANLGAGILNVQSLRDARLLWVRFSADGTKREVRANLLPYWPNGGTVGLQIPIPQDGKSLVSLDLILSRQDLMTLECTYHLDIEDGNLRLAMRARQQPSQNN